VSAAVRVTGVAAATQPSRPACNTFLRVGFIVVTPGCWEGVDRVRVVALLVN
jgi:hypothetical protein